MTGTLVRDKNTVMTSPTIFHELTGIIHDSLTEILLNNYLKILESAVSYAISKVILWITRRRNWRIQNERCLTVLERDSHYKVQTHILNFPKLVGRQRAIGNSRWSIRERRSSPEDSSLGTLGYNIQVQTVLTDMTVVCTLYSAVWLFISAAEKTNKAPFKILPTST